MRASLVGALTANNSELADIYNIICIYVYTDIYVYIHMYIHDYMLYMYICICTH